MRTFSAGLILIAAVALTGVGPAHAASWRIVKDHWSEADEKGFGDFVQSLGETNCSSSESCLRNAANPYRKSDQAFLDIDVDCAKLPYMLRAYYAWKNGLPFSYVDGLSATPKPLIARPRATTSPITATASTGPRRSVACSQPSIRGPIARTQARSGACCRISIRPPCNPAPFIPARSFMT
jgi:hypothetical protein